MSSHELPPQTDFAANKPITTPDGELRRDLTSEELAHFKPASEVLPAKQLEKLRAVGCPSRAATKECT